MSSVRTSNLRLLRLLLLLIAGTLTACDSNNPVDGGGDDGTDIAVPTAYTFESRFEDGASSVAYPGQVVRNLLIQDLKILVDGLADEGAQPITMDDLLARYEHDDSGVSIITGTSPVSKSATYSEISTGKQLADRLAELTITQQPLIGRGDTTADMLVRDYFARIVDKVEAGQIGSPAVYTTEDGIEMSQMINKVLLGAVVYAQGTAKYLNDLDADNNAEPVGSEPFTEMEHHWDEAFGYFGAARNYASYSDADLAGSGAYRDADGDGAIDFNSEYNFTFATYAGRRDQGGTEVDFTQTLFDAFLEGRTAIVNQAPLQDILTHRDQARRTWEELIAANIVHYVNALNEDLNGVTQAQIDAKNNAELNEHWSETKGFAYALQFNPAKRISDAQLQELHTLLGDAPAYALPDAEANAAYRDQLAQAKALLQNTYGFSDANMQAW